VTRQITISGTDPANPRNATQVSDELVAIAKHADDASYRLGQLAHFAAAVRDVLLDQKVPLRRANEQTLEVTTAIKNAASAVDEAAAAIRRADRLLNGSGVIMHASFEWRAGVPGRR
jgi:hypothetical protein